MTRRFFLLTAFGKDRPGIVATLTHTLYKAGANLEDASMTRLGGEFSIMLTLSLPAALPLARFQKQLKPTERKSGLVLTIRPIPSALARGRKESPADGLISVYGTDKPGIVFRVTELLAKRRINITDLQTKVLPRKSAPLYVMLLEVRLPTGMKSEVLRRELEKIRLSLGVDLTYQDIEPLTL